MPDIRFQKGPTQFSFYDDNFDRVQNNETYHADELNQEWARRQRIKCDECGKKYKLTDNVLFLDQNQVTGLIHDARVAHIRKPTMYRFGSIWSVCPYCGGTPTYTAMDYYHAILFTTAFGICFVMIVLTTLIAFGIV